MGGLLKQLDPYQHPRTTGAGVTSAPLLDDGWMDFAAHGTPDDNVGSIEHQLYAVPFVNLDFGREDGDTAAFRRRLWNATMDGQYPTYAGSGPGAKQMTVWFDFMSDTRHWELEPYFDVDGGRALALERHGVRGLRGPTWPGGTGGGETRLRRLLGEIPSMARW